MPRTVDFRLLLIGLCSGFLAVPAGVAMDSVTLKSGARVSGRILAQSKDRVFMEVGSGKVVFSKKAIRRIYEDITDKEPITRVMRPDELPPWWVPLSDLYHSDWVNSLRVIPARPMADGPFHNVPRLSFRANQIYQLDIFGDPENPAALQIGYSGAFWFHSGDAQKRCRQFLASYLFARDQFEALYRLDRTGGQREAGGLTIETCRLKQGATPEWRVTIWNPARLAAARQPTEAAWQAACQRNLALVTRSTNGADEWVKYSFKDAAQRYLPLERMQER